MGKFSTSLEFLSRKKKLKKRKKRKNRRIKCDGTGSLPDPNVGGYQREFIHLKCRKIVDGKWVQDPHADEWKIIATDAEKIS